MDKNQKIALWMFIAIITIGAFTALGIIIDNNEKRAIEARKEANKLREKPWLDPNLTGVEKHLLFLSNPEQDPEKRAEQFKELWGGE